MDKKTMNELADIIITKLEVKQAQWDEEFHSSVNDLYGKETTKEAFIMTEEEALIGELARLQTLLMIFENKEEYEKAAILLSKLNAIKTKLRKGDYDGDDD
jgi:protein-arginine kinase activator protein McsA